MSFHIVTKEAIQSQEVTYPLIEYVAFGASGGADCTIRVLPLSKAVDGP